MKKWLLLCLLLNCFFSVSCSEEVASSSPEQNISLASEVMTMATLRTLHTASNRFKLMPKNKNCYPTVKELKKTGLFYFRETRSNFKYKMTLSKNRRKGFAVTAIPMGNPKGWRSFFIDQTGVLRYTKDGSIPNKKSPAVN